MEVEQVIEILKLEKHPQEGGWFRETYRSKEMIPSEALPDRFTGTRRFATQIFYLITECNFSTFHRVKADEFFHFYLGDMAVLSVIDEAGELREFNLGSDISNGHLLQTLVPSGCWQAVHLRPGGKWALLGATVAPGFEYVDFEEGSRQSLLDAHPRHRQAIMKLTPD